MRRAIATSLLVLAAWLVPASQAAATDAPAWKLTTRSNPTNLIPGDTNDPNGYPLYEVIATNIGGASTSGTVTITDTLPAGVTPFSAGGCSIVAQTVSCTYPYPIRPGQNLWMEIRIAQVNASEGDVIANQATISGGGAPTTTASSEAPVTTALAAFDFLPGPNGLSASLTAPDGSPATQAGSHPYQLTVDLGFPSQRLPGGAGSGGITAAAGGVRDVTTTLPAGTIVDPSATALKCTEAQFESDFSGGGCPDASALGVVAVLTTGAGTPQPSESPLYNMVPTPGTAASFGFNAAGVGIYTHILGGVRAGDYALAATGGDLLSRSPNPVLGVQVQLWGDPSSPAHDYVRGNCDFYGNSCPVTPRSTPLLSMPTSCPESLAMGAGADGWADPGNFKTRSAPLTDANGNPVGISGCNALSFAPTLQARPTSNVADSPTGLSVDLHIPQTDALGTLATAHLRKAVVTLPPGIALNPAGANGLAACSSAQIGIDPGTGVANGNQPSCPDAAKIGEVEVDTPLLPDPLPGAVYVATPHDNPFDSLLAIYVVVDDPLSGILIKLAGHVVPDPQSGQLTTTFDNNPQLPFSDFKLEFKSGPHAVLRTPPTCGPYSTTSELTPWSAPDSGPPAAPHDDYAISQSPGGGSCASTPDQEPNSPSFDAGTVSPIAGAFSPFVVHLSRADGSQNFSTVTLTPPPGLLGKLAGTPACSDAALDAAAHKSGAGEKASPSCPASSQVGTVEVGAGAGPSPYYTTGKAYLTGPYKGAPLSIAIVTPAAAGPYDLGTVVVRSAVNLDPITAQITATSDPIPQILQGIPLDVRSVVLSLDKPNFTLNGTSCDPFAVAGRLLSSLGQIAPLSDRFQLAECSSLGFKPKLALGLKGGTKRNGHPALTSVLTYPQGAYANLAKAAVTLPSSMQLDQSHIQAPCTRPQFAADQCPAASIVGTATATSPLVDYTLSGPVYLRTGNNPLPDLVLDLHGPASQPVRFDVVGKVDTVKAHLRTTFETVPDAPITKAVIQLQGDQKGLLVNNTSLCAQVNRATVLLDGQNGKVADSSPAVKVAGCKKAHKHHKKHKRKHRRHHQGRR